MNLHWQFQIFRIIALLRRRPKTNFDTRLKIHFLQYSPNIFENMIELMTNYIYFSLLVHLKCSFFKQKVLDSFMIFSILPSILRFCWRFMILQSDSNDSFDSVVIFGFINESGKILDSNTTILRDSGQGVRRLYSVATPSILSKHHFTYQKTIFKAWEYFLFAKIYKILI